MMIIGVEVDKFYDARSTEYAVPVSEGYSSVLVALPDNLLYKETKKLLGVEGLEKVLIEKPGALNSEELNELVELAATKQVPFFIDYQRSFDPRVNELTKKVEDLVRQGYELDYISVYSCDKDQPPQVSLRSD